MIKYFCDLCGKELTLSNGAEGRLKRCLGDLEVEVMHAYKKTWNAGQVCHDCVRRVVTEGIFTKGSRIAEGSTEDV